MGPEHRFHYRGKHRIYFYIFLQAYVLSAVAGMHYFVRKSVKHSEVCLKFDEYVNIKIFRHRYRLILNGWEIERLSCTFDKIWICNTQHTVRQSNIVYFLQWKCLRYFPYDSLSRYRYHWNVVTTRQGSQKRSQDQHCNSTVIIVHGDYDNIFFFQIPETCSEIASFAGSVFVFISN